MAVRGDELNEAAWLARVKQTPRTRPPAAVQSSLGMPKCKVLNIPESGDNVWHNLHWIVPAAARLAASRNSVERGCPNCLTELTLAPV